MFSYSDEYRTRKTFKYVKRMLPLFRAVVKFCSTNRLLRYEILQENYDEEFTSA